MWSQEIDKYCDKEVLRILIGNKCDLYNREVDFTVAETFAQDNNFFIFFETSAQNGKDIEKVIYSCRLSWRLQDNYL